jgi:antitoxin component of MazEF toxin-antitoxin module
LSQLPIIRHGDTAAVVLPAAVLELLGLHVGDVVDATVTDRQLILRPAADADRHQRVQEITEEVLERRRDAYRRLA